MLEYRVYLLDQGGKIVERFDLNCTNDAEAVADGKRHLPRNNVEIWCGNRSVGHLDQLNWAEPT